MANKFGTRDMQRLIDLVRVERLKLKAAGDDRAASLMGDVADTLDGAQRYYGAVEGALA